MSDISKTVKFRDVVTILEKIKHTKLVVNKVKYLKRYYDSFQKHRMSYRQEQGIPIETLETGNNSFYCILRCIIPSTDSAREPYGIQINTLGKVYTKVLQLPNDSADAMRLQTNSNNTPQGDYADILATVLSTRCREEPSELSLAQIHEMLDSIAGETRRNTEKILTQLVEVASVLEQKWFIRLLLKSMGLGITQERVFEVLHPEAKTLFLRCSDLHRVCRLLADNRLEDIKPNDIIEPSKFVRPQLCEVFPGNVEPLMQADVLYLETKMDGERFQLHFLDGKYKYISRNGVDYTYRFGESPESGNLTPKLASLLPLGLSSIILDGEMMVWDGSRFCVKGENTDVKNLNRLGQQPCFVCYDLLYLNGQSYLEVPYVQRAHKMREIIKEKQGVLQVMKPIKISNIQQFKALFQAALDSNEEGVVLKKQNAIYKPGARNGGGWYKAKADYIHGLTTEFDLLIIGGFYNNKKTFIESFLLGSLQYNTDSDYKVFSVGKVANVFKQRVVLCESLKPHWHNTVIEPPPLWYHYKPNNNEGKPDVWIDPKFTQVLKIKAADLAPSSAFYSTKCLHFPRIEEWRNDKFWQDALSNEDYENMAKGARGLKKITSRELVLEDVTTNKRSKLTAAQKRNLGLLAYDKKFQPDKIEKSSDILEGYSICILSGSTEYSVDFLKMLVIQNGAELVANPIPNNECCLCVADERTLRVKAIIKQSKYNVASVPWLVRTAETQVLTLKPLDMLAMTSKVAAKFAEQYDAYGDSFTEFVAPHDLKIILDSISEEMIANITDLEAIQLKSRLDV